MKKWLGSSRDQYWTCFWSIWSYLAAFSNRMTFPLIIWGTFNWNEKRQLLKHKVIWFFCFTQTINEKKSLRVLNSWGRPQLFCPSLTWVTTLIATQEGVCCIAHSVKTFPKPFLWNESTSSIKHRKGTGSNMLKIPSDISSHLTQCTSEEQEHRILSENWEL